MKITKQEGNQRWLPSFIYYNLDKYISHKIW